VILGGSVDQPGFAKVKVHDGEEVSALLERVSGMALADQVDVFAVSPHAASTNALEVGLWPHVFGRTTLTDEQQEIELSPYNGKSEFWRVDVYAECLMNAGHHLVSIGADGGSEGNLLLISLHSLSGPCLSIVKERVIFPDYRGLLHSRLKCPLVMCTTTAGKPITGICDPDHVEKRQQDQLQGGGHIMMLGPNNFASAAILYSCGVHPEVIVKPDPMSDDLTRQFFSGDTIQKIIDHCPWNEIDGSGTGMFLFFIGQGIDATQSNMQDIERVAMVHVTQVFLKLVDAYVATDPVLKLTPKLYKMHGTPAGNISRTFNAVKALDLTWLESFGRSIPRYPR
jgi:hypothetical protein